MYSVRGTRVVNVHRKKSDLGFSVKGGLEHGIPIVVSSIDQNNSTVTTGLRLGDEIIAVNNEPLEGLTHSQAIQKLKNGGPVVALKIKSNQALEDVFLSGPPQQTKKADVDHQTDATILDSSTSLPQGWSQKIDHKTGRPYYENHYTETSTWSDPHSIEPSPLKGFDWSHLPPGWERFTDQEGDIYYVNHDTQTSHWDSPRGLRQQKQLKELKIFIKEAKRNLKIDLEDLKEKRASLLEKTQLLEKAHSETISLDESQNQSWDSPTDIADDVMMLNDEVDALDERTTSRSKRITFQETIAKQCLYEDIGERDENESSVRLSEELVSTYDEVKTLESRLHDIIRAFETLRKQHSFTAAPISYMVQLPPRQQPEDVENVRQWLHTLPDRLTPKTNCEMQLEVAIMKDCRNHATKLYQRCAELYRNVKNYHGNWEPLLDELARLDLSLLQDHWMQANFKEKLHKVLSFED